MEMKFPQKERSKGPAGVSEKVIRIFEIYKLISQKRYPSVSFLQGEYEVSRRTVHRYLETINSFDAIELDRQIGGYKLVNDTRIKTLKLKENEIICLLALSGLSESLGHTFKESFQSIISKLADISEDKSRVPLIVKSADAIETDKLNAYFQTMFECIQSHYSADITYKNLDDGEISQRRIDPLGFIYHEGVWLVVAYCHLRDGIRKFGLDRIVSLNETWLSFTPPEGFDLNKHIQHSWSIWDDKDEVEVVLKFAAEVAEYVTRKDKWHPSEKRTILPTGEVKLTFVVAGVREIKRWIYQWVPAVEVLAPKWFRDQVSRELAASSQKHS